jgi:predicted AlkP superfamily phosphohydrolase/phosphomutase
MREMNFTIDISSAIDISIRVVDEKLFTEKYDEYILEKGDFLLLDDLTGEHFKNCVEVVQKDNGFYEEKIDEYYDVIDEFLGREINF